MYTHDYTITTTLINTCYLPSLSSEPQIAQTHNTERTCHTANVFSVSLWRLIRVKQEVKESIRGFLYYNGGAPRPEGRQETVLTKLSPKELTSAPRSPSRTVTIETHPGWRTLCRVPGEETQHCCRQKGSLAWVSKQVTSCNSRNSPCRWREIELSFRLW